MDYNVPHNYNYIILFKGKTKIAGPIFRRSSLEEMRAINAGKMHPFDEDLAPIMTAIWYCLHMPRIEFDTYDMDIEVLDKAYDIPHNIVVMPESEFFRFIPVLRPTLIIYGVECSEEVKNQAINSGATIGAISTLDLSNELLTEHWNILFDNRILKSRKKLKDIDNQFLLDNDRQLILPELFIARQHEEANRIYNDGFNSADVHKTCAELLWNQLLWHNAMMYCKDFRGKEKAAFRKMFSEGMEEAKKSTRMNLVITMPGVPQRQIEYGGLATHLPSEEKELIRLLGIHRAIAREALLIELQVAGKELFNKLNELELNCKQGTNNKYVHRALRDIGIMFEKKLTKEQLIAINKSKHITIFSDFPIGLAIIGGAEVPLQCYKEISYRPLSPLTRCMQKELSKQRQIYYGSGCKIAFVECIPNDKQNREVRAWSDSIAHSLKISSEENEKIQVVFGEALTIRDLKKFLSDNSDADILHLSAHGYYDRKINMAGLMIGDEFWMADESDYRVPPVVILSACHVSPRGSGTVNVADLFMRVGATAVLGNFIPIHAKRNTILLNRLYTYISGAQKGSAQYKTLSEAWSGIVATNAIHEIAETSKNFFEWIWGINDKGKQRMIDFTMNRSVGRLHGKTIYTNTISVIKEMLFEEGLEGKFDDILNQENYFPESVFYQWIGSPENIFLYNEGFSKVIASLDEEQ